MKHVVLYLPGLGDTSLRARRLLVAGWYIYGVQPIVHPMNWSDKRPFEVKFQELLEHIDQLVSAGHTVSLVGESAGASAALNAYAARPQAIHRVACICGKLRNAQSVSSRVYRYNPAFAESMRRLPESLAGLDTIRLRRVRSVHPLHDATVPVSDTVVPGAESKTIVSVGHPTSIVLGDTLFSYTLVGFLKRKN